MINQSYGFTCFSDNSTSDSTDTSSTGDTPSFPSLLRTGTSSSPAPTSFTMVSHAESLTSQFRAIRILYFCHKEPDGIHLVVYHAGQSLSLGSLRLQITLFKHKMSAICF